MKIALCQLNPVTGDIAGNTGRITSVVAETAAQSPDLLVFPELFITGYPPLDLLENDWFIAQSLSALDTLARLSMQYPGIGIITGIPLPDTVTNGRGLFNSAALVTDGMILFHQNKSLLPTYDVFDEARYFDPAPEISLVEFKGEKLGITICEDAWNDEELWRHPRYNFDPVKILSEQGATVLINVSASPFHLGKRSLRFSIMRNHAMKFRKPFIFVNMAGANDELVFDGTSMYFDRTGSLAAILPGFAEEVRIVDTNAAYPAIAAPEKETVADVFNALVTGIRDYTRKCGFSRALVGLSGGIDSAVTCAIAAAALGAKQVFGVTMPSEYSSEGSVKDSELLAANLGITLKQIPITDLFKTYLDSLSPHFNGRKPDSTEENIQARIRGDLLMALSNKFGCLLLTTGNKSELAVGYATLYGDMCGGLAVISDLYKTMVYEIARYINREKEIIPSSILDKPPSAELRPGQKDTDSLPPYDVLDAILRLLIEEGASIKTVVAKGFAEETVTWVAKALARTEYKRRQAAPGLKITPKAFGCGRKFPLAAKYSR
jgi:NAD+ synthase (glutamine-hydrolysing)